MADFNNAVVWMISTRPLISKSSSPCTITLVTVPRAPITIAITVTFLFQSFLSSLARSRYLSFFSLSFSFTQWSAETAKATILQVLLLLLTITWSGRLAMIRWSVWSQNPKEFCAFHYYYHFTPCEFSLQLCWYFLEVWMTGNLIRSPGLFSVLSLIFCGLDSHNTSSYI